MFRSPPGGIGGKSYPDHHLSFSQDVIAKFRVRYLPEAQASGKAVKKQEAHEDIGRSAFQSAFSPY
jgi:hypothetical protein